MWWCLRIQINPKMVEWSNNLLNCLFFCLFHSSHLLAGWRVCPSNNVWFKQQKNMCLDKRESGIEGEKDEKSQIQPVEKLTGGTKGESPD